MKKLSILLSIILISFACKNNNTPKGILEKNQMTDILIDIHRLEAKIAVKNLPNDSSKLYYYKLQEEIFKSYHTDSAKFNNSFRYYLSNGAAFDNIYASVVDSLSLEEVQQK